MKPLVLSSICVLTLVCAAKADVVYNNLASPTFRGDVVSSTTGLGPLANSFLTGPSTFSELNSVGVLLGGDPTTGGSVSIDLVSSPGGALLLPLGTVSDSQLPSTPGTFAEFFFSAAFMLAPGQQYWIQISGLPGPDTSAQWAFSADQTGVGVLGNSFANFNGTFANFSVPDADPYQMEVDVTPGAAVPEPGSFLLLGSGLLGLIGAVRRTC